MNASEEMANKAREWLKTPEALSYLRRWELPAARASVNSGLDFNHLEEADDIVLLSFFQYFWEALPDIPDIRTGAFFRVCDFAEFYCFEMEDDKREK